MTTHHEQEPWRELVQRCRMGQQAAWGELVDRAAPVLAAAARQTLARHGRRDPDLAGTVVQQTWLELLEKPAALEDCLAGEQDLPGRLAERARQTAERLLRSDSRRQVREGHAAQREADASARDDPVLGAEVHELADRAAAHVRGVLHRLWDGDEPANAPLDLARDRDRQDMHRVKGEVGRYFDQPPARR